MNAHVKWIGWQRQWIQEDIQSFFRLPFHMNDLSSLIPTLRRQRGKFLEILEKLDSKKIVKYSRILLEIFEKIVKKKKKRKDVPTLRKLLKRGHGENTKYH